MSMGLFWRDLVVLLILAAIGFQNVTSQECKTVAFVDTIMSRQYWSGEHISIKYGYELL